MVELLGVPFDLGSVRSGGRLGPEALRLAGLREALGLQNVTVADMGDVPVAQAVATDRGFHAFDETYEVVAATVDRVGDILARGAVPLVMGGDHSLSMGSVGAALRHLGDDLALLWIDAHADVNTPASSPSGNLHGMPIAALLGMDAGIGGEEAAQWDKIRATLGSSRLRPDRVGWIGLRMVDPGEVDAIKGLSGCYATTIQDVDRRGVEAVVRGVDAWIRTNGARHLWISFDVDVLDPFLAPGTGTAVRGGLTYREAHLMAELLYEQLQGASGVYRLVGLDVVEVNPIIDSHNETAQMAVEWVASLFGKTILGGGPGR